MDPRIKIGSLVMADNSDALAKEPIFVFGYICDIATRGSGTSYYAVDWITSTNIDEANLGVIDDYEIDNIKVYLEIYDDWMNNRYDKNKKYGKDF